MDFKDLIKEQLLQENYQTILEIKELANDILHTLAEINFPRLKETDWENAQYIGLEGVHIDNVKHKSPPTILKDFVDKVNLRISFRAQTGFDDHPDIFDPKYKGGFESKTQGVYQNLYHPGKAHNVATGQKDRDILTYDEDTFKTILLTYDPKTVKDKIHSLKHEKIFKTEFTVFDLYSFFYYQFIKTLIHELRHAYDDYVSKAKGLYLTRQMRQYLDKYGKKSIRTDHVFSNNVEKSLEKHKAYLNLPHEIWARFTSAFQRINFYKVDWDDTPDGGIKVIVRMEPIQESIRDLKNYMPDFHALHQHAKQRLYKLISAYWHKAKEQLPAYQALKQKQFTSVGNSDLSDMNEDLSASSVSVDFGNQQIKVGKEVIGTIQLFDRENGYVILDKILIFPEARGKGYATAAMKQIMDKYRSEGKILTLTPDAVYGANKNKLLKWYRSLGFVLNKGKNKDFKTMQLLYLPIS